MLENIHIELDSKTYPLTLQQSKGTTKTNDFIENHDYHFLGYYSTSKIIWRVAKSYEKNIKYFSNNLVIKK